MLFLTNINLNKNELQNAIIQNLTADPSPARVGQIYYNTVDKVLKQFNGTTWDVVGKELTPATYSALGGVIVDSTTLTVDNSGNLAVKVPTDNNFTTALKNKLDDIEAGAEVNVIETITVNGTAVSPDDSRVVAIYTIESATFTDDSTSTPAAPVLLTLTDGENQTVTANIPKVSSSSAGVVPKALSSAVSTPTQTTKFLMEDGTWGTPVYTPGADYVKKDGSTTMTGALNMGSHAITGVTDPTNAQDAATKNYVDSAINALPEAMVFKGTIGSGGNLEWSALPTAGSTYEGQSYKVITAHNTTPICEVGDVIVCANTSLTSTPSYEWVVIPSGDEPTGTVTNIATGSGLNGGPITTTGTISLATAYGDTVNPYGSKTANYVLAAPNGSAGTPSFRALVAADIPDLSATYQAKGNYKTTQSEVQDPSVSGNSSALEFISNISQNTNGVITPTKKKVYVEDTLTSGSTNPVTSGAVYTAIQTLTGGATSKITITNPALTAVSEVFTWTIAAGSSSGQNSLGSDINITVYEVGASNKLTKVIPEIEVASTGAITITINDTQGISTLAAGTYKAVIVG